MEGLLTGGSSIYHRLIALYARRHDGTLLHCTNDVLQENWSAFRALRDEYSTTPHYTARKVCLPFAAYGNSASCPESATGILLERAHAGSFISGIVIRANTCGSLERLDDYFMDLVLRCTQGGIPTLVTTDLQTNDTTVDKIVDLFDTTLRNVTPDDQWPATGREHFSQRIKHFTRHGMKIEFALPAFPCKSSNANKVGGSLPDRGEMIALATLHEFVMDVEQLYAPGARVLIVSDGHVFSDCIGVDDSMVDLYSKHLRMMNDTLSAAFHDDGRQRVHFHSLAEMLQIDGDDLRGPGLVQHLGLDPISHHIAQVQFNDDAELCRRLLMQGFKADVNQLRSRIVAQDPAILRLYRGFSRFMLEDLERNVYTEHLSKSQRRKLSSKVAFEMIERNQAYSNLVEMVLPYHVRLSIHAHNNAGPKFGVNLMGPHVRATNSLPPDGQNPESCDLLHVPTPWHGCIVEIAGDGHLYLAKVEQVRAAIQNNKVLAAWVVPRVGEKRSMSRYAPGRSLKHSSDSGGLLSAAYFSLITTDMQYHI